MITSTDRSRFCDVIALKLKKKNVNLIEWEKLAFLTRSKHCKRLYFNPDYLFLNLTVTEN